MKLVEHAQGSYEWMQARSGIPTASEFDALITPKFKIRTGEMPRTYLAKKVAEYWQDGPLPSFNTVDMDIGQILEERAKPWYELETGQAITNVGLCLTDDGRVGCSPDGLLGDDGGIEIKCPALHTHVKYLLDGEVPDEYQLQVHGSMYVTGRQWWQFLSYASRFPKLLIKVERDEEKIAVIHEALSLFLDQFDQAVKQLEEINGGPRPVSLASKMMREMPISEDII